MRLQHYVYSDFIDRSIGDTLLSSDFPSLTNSTKTRRQFTDLLKQESVELCLAEGLTCRAVTSDWAVQKHPGHVGPRVPH